VLGPIGNACRGAANRVYMHYYKIATAIRKNHGGRLLVSNVFFKQWTIGLLLN
jgi:hypothetical protein